jgi:hypothetical protein
MTSQPIPAPRPEQVSPLEFTPVPRRYRHDGWTPERQRAFIAALAETGCVERAARMVNIAQTNCYELRRAPGAESFRRAWDAALDFALPKLKDVAFQRAIEGELVPVFSGGKLLGFRRKYNDKLLMFCLRHYGQDANGKRTTINYFSTRASAGSADGAAADDPGEPFVRAGLHQAIAIGALEPPMGIEEFVPFVPGEAPWQLAGAEMSAERAALETPAPPKRPARAQSSSRGKPRKTKPEPRRPKAGKAQRPAGGGG